MRADEYVVQQLQIAQREAEETRAANIFLRQDNRELEKEIKTIRSLFECKETTGGNGYAIYCKQTDGTYCGAIAYCWDKNNVPQDFLDWLKVLGLELPIEQPKEPNTEELEKDPQLVAQALEKAKELQAQQKAEKENENVVEEK